MHVGCECPVRSSGQARDKCAICQHRLDIHTIDLPCDHQLHRECLLAQFRHTCLRPNECPQTKMKWKIRDNVKGRKPACCTCVVRYCPLCRQQYYPMYVNRTLRVVAPGPDPDSDSD